MTRPTGGRAAIEVIGDASKFAPRLEKDLRRALRDVDVDAAPITDKLTTDLEKGVAEAGKTFTELEPPAKKALSKVATDAHLVFEQMKDDAAEFGDEVKVKFSDARAAAKTMREEAKAGAKEVAREVAKEAADSDFWINFFDEEELAAHAKKTGKKIKDGLGEGLDGAGGEFEDLGVKAKTELDKIEVKARTTATKIDNAFKRAAGHIGDWLGKLPGFLLKLTTWATAGAAAVGPLVIGLIGVANAVAKIGKASAGLAPLVAFLPEFAGAAGLVAGTLALLGPGLAKAFTPITKAFVDADGNAGALAQRLQFLAGNGIEPLARAFVKVNLPTIAFGMESVAKAANQVVFQTGRWLNSTQGQLLIKDITFATAAAMESLSPKISDAAIAVGRLSTLAGGRGISLFAETLGKIVDRFTEWANSRSIDDVQNALSDLGHIFDRVRDTFKVLVEVGRWLGENQEKVKGFATAIGLVGLALAAITANPFAFIIAGISLLITNWDRVVKVFTAAKAWWEDLWTDIQNNAAIQGLVAALRRHFDQIGPVFQNAFGLLKTEVGPALEHLKRVILDDVVPALTRFIDAASPIVVFFATRFLPVVVDAVKGIVDVVSGLFKILSGLLDVFSGLIKGDWSLLWHGLVEIGSGFVDVVIAIFGTLWRTIVATVVAGGVGIGKAFGRAVDGTLAPIGRAIADLVTWVGHWFAELGRWIGRVASSIGSAFADAWSATTDFFVGIGRFFAELPGKVGAFLASLPAVLAAAIGAAFDAALVAVGVGIGLLLVAVLVLPPRIWAALQALPGVLGDAITAAWEWAKAKFSEGVEFVVSEANTLPGRIWAGLSSLGSLIGDLFTTAWDAAWRAGVAAGDAVVAWAFALPGRVGAALSSLGSAIAGAFTAALDWAKNVVTDGFNSIVSFIFSVPGRIGALAGQMLEAGRSLIRGLMSGLGEAGGFAGDLASRITSSIKGFLNQVIGKINSGIGAVDDALPGISLPRIPSLATGGLTTREGLANLHARELVLPLEDRRATDLLARALAEANAGLRATGVLPSTTPSLEVRVFLGTREITDIVRVEVDERERDLVQRVLAGTGRR